MVAAALALRRGCAVIARLRHLPGLVVLLLAACASPPPPSSPLPVAPPPGQEQGTELAAGDSVEVSYYPAAPLETTAYLIGPGDVLRLDVADHPELSRERVLVLPDGFVAAPLNSRLAAAGKRADQLAEDLARFYRQRQVLNPVVTVAVEQADARIDALMRSVARPGRSDTLTLLVDRSGFLDLPFVGQVSVRQPFLDMRRQIVDTYRQQFGKRLEVTVNVRSRQTPVVYVIGEVVTPGAVNVTGPLTPFMAVASAGGFRRTAKESDVRVYRYRPGGQLDHWSFDLTLQAAADKQPPPRLDIVARDIVFVPKSGIAVANDAIEQYIRNLLPFGLGVGAYYQLPP